MEKQYLANETPTWIQEGAPATAGTAGGSQGNLNLPLTELQVSVEQLVTWTRMAANGILLADVSIGSFTRDATKNYRITSYIITDNTSDTYHITCTVSMTYDDANGGRCTQVVYDFGGGITITETISYDANGRVSGITRAIAGL